ncbi:glycosyltransferase family 4 protein [Parathalassolituus penaei]|uniref:Glycosyltransferase family 4 protein n=1 Tax=Parathalassolituus penaei TaxID=2997323 RepID=A0A9X3EHJ7_9GAMM|nr:glycosyltransferase family 4 protein [Parathalassolituus penaei]MCY0966835.1 glycosyltransferase family 4 protein [Parathalassolituus penaei]
MKSDSGLRGSDPVYLLLDPVNRTDSGITRYSNSAVAVLNKSGIPAHVLSIESDESLEQFRQRVATYCSENPVSMVESPETYGAANLVLSVVPVHIRLHFSKYIGQVMEGKLPDEEAFLLEKIAIHQARYISAPSHVADHMTRRFFEYESCSIFANPLCESLVSSEFEREIAVGFVGRWHSLKGTDYFLALARLFPELKFYVVSGDEAQADLGRFPNVEFLGPLAKSELYERCHIVVVPSVFETFSMVALEALAKGCIVVCWDHLGIVEYFSTPVLFTAKKFELASMKLAVESALSSKSHGGECAEIAIASYVLGVRALLQNSIYVDPNATGRVGDFDINYIFKVSGKMSVLKKKGSFSRKLRKLFVNPRQFFLDFYRKRTGKLVVSQDRSKVVLPVVKNTPAAASIKYDIDFSLENYSKYLVSEVDVKHRAMRVLFMSDGDFEFSNDILLKVDGFKDFWPLRHPNLKYGKVDCSFDWNCYEMLRSIPPATRSRFGAFRVIFLWNISNPEIAKFLRCCDPDIIVAGVYDGSKPFDFDALSPHFDVLIGDIPEAVSARKIYYCKNDFLHVVIRKVVQEAIVSPGGYLVPVWNGLKYRPGLEDFDTGFYSGLAVLRNPDFEFSGFSHDSFIEYFVDELDDLFVTDQVYYRYKSMFEDFNNRQCRVDFVRLFLLDGYMFDVE